MIKEGFGHYDEKCESCHGAPGKNNPNYQKD